MTDEDSAQLASRLVLSETKRSRRRSSFSFSGRSSSSPFSQLLFRSCAHGGARMERSWAAVESLDTLWFFSNVLWRARPLSPAAEAEETEEKGGGGGGGEPPVENQADGPEDETALAKPVATTTEDSLPRCPRCGILDAEVAELGVMKSSAVETVGTPESAEEGSKLKEWVRRSKRRQRSRRMFRERRRSVLGELDLGCDGEDFSGFEENRVLVDHRRRGSGVASGVQAVKKMPPLSDGIAMREHLRSWAIAVACAVK